MFVLVYESGDGDNFTNEKSYRRYFPPSVKTENYNIEIDGRNFYDQPINDSIKQYDEKYEQDKVMIILLVVY